MKMAICISGQMRSYEDCYQQFHNQVVSKNNCDLFISTWNCLGYDYHLNPYDPQQLVYSTKDYNLVKTENLLCYKPKLTKIDCLEDFNQKHLNHRKLHRIERNMYAMYYKIKDCFELVKQHESITGQKYDYVMRVRPDLYFLREFPLQANLWKFKETHYAFPDGPTFGGFNDQFGVAKRDVMEKVCSLWDYLDEYMQIGLDVPGCAETLLKTHLEKLSIPHQLQGHPSQNMKYTLMRMHPFEK